MSVIEHPEVGMREQEVPRMVHSFLCREVHGIESLLLGLSLVSNTYSSEALGKLFNLSVL